MIRKLLLVLTLLLAVSMVFSVDCDDGNTCGDSQTCCSKGGRSGCCDYKNAVCCNDGVHCCPEATACDLGRGKCLRRGSITFLSEENFAPKKIISHKKNFAALASKIALQITPEEQSQLISGFLDGSELRQYVPDLSDCSGNTTSVVNSLRQAIADFAKENVTFDDIAHGISMIGVAVQGIANATLSCKTLPSSIMTVVVYLKKIAEDPATWFSKVSSSATRNSIYIMMDLYALQSLIDSKKYKDVGFKIGEVTKYIFKVDLSMRFTTLFKQPEVSPVKMGIDFNKIIQCGFTVYSVAERAIPLAQDLINNPNNFTTDLFALYGLFQEVSKSCAGVFNTTIVETAFNKVMAANYLALSSDLAPAKLKSPSITDIIACVKTIRPLATDIYNAVVAFQSGDMSKAWPALEQASLDVINLGYTCYKVIADLFE